MRSFLQRWRRVLDDRLRYSPLARGLLSRYVRWRARRMPRATDQERGRAINRLCDAARLAATDSAVANLQDLILNDLAQLNEANLDWTEFIRDIEKPWMVKAALLKPSLGPREKGVLFVSFEGQWAKLLRHGDIQDFARRYTLVVSPSSSPHHLVNYAFAAAYPGPIFSLLSNPEDLVEVPRGFDNIHMVPLFASHWVNPALFQQPPRRERPFDLLMVASFGKVKRHHVLFKALRRMPRDIRVLLIGQEQEGRTADTIHQEAKWYGVRDRYEIRSNQPFLKVVEAFGQARTSLVLSRREGSCVVVAESLFADTPVAILHGARLGSRVFINERTGQFLHERFLAHQLTEFVREAERFEPYAWAMENISCFKSTQALNNILKEHASREGQAWTQDIYPLQWCPDPMLVHGEDRRRMEEERRLFQERYGLEVGYPADREIT